jgi:two-component system CheB/CheR fusion protein
MNPDARSRTIPPLTPVSPPPLCIFLVENHADTLLYLRRYLEQLGHRVETADTLRAALEKIPHTAIDLLISDIGLPDGDGWQLLEQLGPDLPFPAVAMSGCGANADRKRSRAAGYRHHLFKPFLPEELDPILAEAAQRADRS